MTCWVETINAAHELDSAAFSDGNTGSYSFPKGAVLASQVALRVFPHRALTSLLLSNRKRVPAA